MRGFMRDSKGNITVFDADAADVETTPAGINDWDEIVGDTGGHSFLRDSKGIWSSCRQR